MARLTVKGWGDFQHYKDRDPPWIKLHKKLLDDYEFQMLQLASRALAPMFWLLASESKDGSFDADPAKLAFRLRTSEKVINEVIKELIDKGFLVGDSAVLASCKRDAMPETETETETETTLSGKPDANPLREKNQEARESAKRVLSFLNEKTGRAYRPTPAIVDMIAARIRDGATETECRQIIVRKGRDWSADEKMSQYLRPKTLFSRTNFENYLGELVA